jgi:hypothetical protein
MQIKNTFHNFNGIFFLILILSGLIIGCKNSATLPERIGDVLEGQSELKRYAVGKGGGFTGDYQEYILCEDGKVYKQDFNYDREIFTKQLPEEEITYFLKRIDDLDLGGISIEEPGNMSYYIEIREGKLSLNKIVWGLNTYYPPKELELFHEELFKKLAAWE